jgi:hypothetical protein
MYLELLPPGHDSSRGCVPCSAPTGCEEGGGDCTSVFNFSFRAVRCSGHAITRGIAKHPVACPRAYACVRAKTPCLNRAHPCLQTRTLPRTPTSVCLPQLPASVLHDRICLKFCSHTHPTSTTSLFLLSSSPLALSSLTCFSPRVPPTPSAHILHSSDSPIALLLLSPRFFLALLFLSS